MRHNTHIHQLSDYIESLHRPVSIRLNNDLHRITSIDQGTNDNEIIVWTMGPAGRYRNRFTNDSRYWPVIVWS